VESEPEIYDKEELKKFFASCDEGERLWFEFFLMTRMREQEVMHVCWKDIKFADCVVRVSYKPDRGWTPKAYKEREIPVPAKLMGSLKKLHRKSAYSTLNACIGSRRDARHAGTIHESAAAASSVAATAAKTSGSSGLIS
jgi:integrase